MVRVRAYAKINLALEVLNKRLDGFKNVRTIFKTISVYESLGIEFQGGRKTAISINSDIADNLVVRAAHLLLDEMRMHAAIDFHLTKRIPMGAGLGGGSSDAAAVLRTLPTLAGREVPMQRLIELGAQLGSDVPFFLVGGCALGLGRGTELYPLPDPPELPALLVAPPIHASTPQAPQVLKR